MMSRDSARGRSQNQLRMIPSFLTADDTDRVFRTIRKLAEHDISDWALTGGLAVEMHIQNRGHTPRIRTLNDLDFITREFEGIPTSLAGEFLFRHVHPLDPPGKTILQLIDRDMSLRVDVFRPYGATMSRTTNAGRSHVCPKKCSGVMTLATWLTTGDSEAFRLWTRSR